MDGTNGLKAKLPLGVNVFTAPKDRWSANGPSHSASRSALTSMTSTLIFGEYDAVLVDAMTDLVAEAEALAGLGRTAQPQP